MDTNIDYSSYTYAELLEARSQLDAEAYPGRAKMLDILIEQRQPASERAKPKAKQELPVIRSSKVVFHGNAKEFFSIWIVNLLLTILTLGIYSAWAKVRTNRYFYSSTEVDGHRFSYLAEPLQILKGRIIAVTLLGAYFLLSHLSPAAGLVAMLVLMVAMPYLMVQGMKFNMKMTGYRNVRFAFDGDYWGAFVHFMLYPFLSVFTLYLALPWVMKKMDQYIVEHTYLGKKAFAAHLATSEYYKASFGAVGLALVVGTIVFSILGFSISELAQQPEPGFSMAMFMIPIAYLLIYVVCSSFYGAIVRNHIFNNSQLQDSAQFSSSVTFGSLLALKSTNFAALILTLGLAMPWVKVRNAKYYTEKTVVAVTAEADRIEADPERGGSATTDEVANAFDVDLALG